MSRGAPMVGRERELDELREALDAAAGRSGRLLLVAGEAGVGKTRLVDESLAGCDRVVLRSVATERGSAAYGPIFAALCGRLDQRPPAEHRERLFETIVGALAEAGNAVVFLDDLQWADAATLELLASLAASVEGMSLLVLAAYRTEEIPRGHPLRRLRTDLRRAGRFAELVVLPLDEPATSTLAAHGLGGEPGQALAATLYDRTQGVPFFVEELAAALRAGTGLVATARGLELDASVPVPVPETVRDAVRLRAEGLSADARRTLEAAAAAGTRFDLELLSALGEDAGLAEALEHGPLEEVESGIAAFRHDLVREALSLDTPWPRRRALHRALAAELATRDAEPRLVADHWLAGHDGPRARPFLLAAMRRLSTLHAYRDAAAAARTALEHWPDGQDETGRVVTLRELGRCVELCGELGEAARAWEEASAALDGSDAAVVGEVQRELAAVYTLQGHGVKATAARAHAADAFVAAGDHAEAANQHLALAELAASAGQFDAILMAADAALAAARRAGRGDLEARALVKRAFALHLLARPHEADEAARTGLAAAQASNEIAAIVDAYWMLGTLANHAAAYATAESTFEAAIEVCRANDRRPEEHVCLACLALVLYNRGEWDRATAVARDVLRAGGVDRQAVEHAHCALGSIYAARGQVRRARSHLAAAVASRRAVGLTTAPQCATGLAFLGELEQPGGDHWAQLVHGRPDNLTLFYVQGLRWAATCAAARSDATLVQACADALSGWSSRFGGPDVQAGLAHALGELALLDGDPVRACDQFTLALDLLRPVDAPFDRATVLLRLGVALAAAGEREPAVDRLVEAHRRFRRLGARPFAVRAADELAALGEPLERRLGRRSAAEVERQGLTRRELEILRLVAVGRTNREIARELFLSPRTVEMHVRHLLAKLDCRSRTEATARAHALGLLTPPLQGSPRAHGA